MRLFHPLSWISSRGNSPVPNAEDDRSSMTAPLSNVANNFNSHAAAHNERVYGGLKRKQTDDTQRRNREITDFFSSSSPMGAQQSNEMAEVRADKKRKLTHSRNDKESNAAEKKHRVNSKDDPAKIGSPVLPLAGHMDSDSDESLQNSRTQTKSRLQSLETHSTLSPPTLYEYSNDDSDADLESCRNIAKMNPFMTVEEREREQKRQILAKRMRHGDRPPWTSPFYQMKPDVQEHLVDDLRGSFRYQINLEVKLQHEKLQEIRAEIAKSQVALEQLRRCHLIPFPQTYADPESMLNIMEGTGPAIPQANGTKPQWATPFGVTEGAYTRHYAKWLIPDPRFDGVAYKQPKIQQSGYPFPNMEIRMDGRQTRNSFQLDPVPTSKRRGRGDAAAPLQALSSGYAQKKEDAGPSVLKRGDGQWVKLVCIDCQRENFGSTQGFINHCRIAHRREFKSHEEAAINSGHVVEVDQFGSLVGEEKIPASVAYEGLVHHKIRSTPLDWSAAKDVLKHVNDALRQFRDGSLAGIERIPGEKADTVMVEAAAADAPKPSKDFAPAASTPHLSKFLKSAGFNKSLDSEVNAAKVPVAEPTDNDDNSDDEEDTIVVEDIPPKDGLSSNSNPPALPHLRAPILQSMRPSNGSNSHAPILPPIRLVSKKGQAAVHLGPQMAKAREVQAKINATANNRLPPPPAIPQESSMDDADDDALIVEDGSDIEMGEGDELSPTMHSEGDKAPSLVSDDDDYTAESEGDSDGENDDTEGSVSEEEAIEVRDESDEARSRKRTESRDELESRVLNERRGKANKGRKGVGFVSPVKDIKTSKGKARR